MANEDVLNCVQEVLRGVTVCLALEQHADMARLSSVLQAYALGHTLSSEAHRMLMDLAIGVAMLGSAESRKT